MKSGTYYYMPVASGIPRNGFFELHQYLHFVDNSTILPPESPGYERLGKITPVLRMLSERLAGVYNHGKDVNIEKTMIPFKGRSCLKQYLPFKPI